MGVNVPLTQSYSSGGSSNVSGNTAQSVSNAYSATEATTARQFSAEQAAIARAFSAAEAQKQREFNAAEAEKLRAWQEVQNKIAMDYNSAEAKVARDWNQANIDTANQMANTVYSRSVADMKRAGINPILAYSHGLSAAGTGSVTSGAGASIAAPSGSAASGGMAQSFAGQSFMDTNSASHSESSSQGWGKGSSWQNSESGLATFLGTMGTTIDAIMDNLSSSNTIKVAIDGLEDLMGGKYNDWAAEKLEDVKESYDNSSIGKTINNIIGPISKRIQDAISDKKSKKGNGGGAW